MLGQWLGNSYSTWDRDNLVRWLGPCGHAYSGDGELMGLPKVAVRRSWPDVANLLVWTQAECWEMLDSVPSGEREALICLHHLRPWLPELQDRGFTEAGQERIHRFTALLWSYKAYLDLFSPPSQVRAVPRICFAMNKQVSEAAGWNHIVFVIYCYVTNHPKT